MLLQAIRWIAHLKGGDAVEDFGGFSGDIAAYELVYTNCLEEPIQLD